ncbi:phosphoesterase [Sinimarinibacterium sp. CAU 1509]|uniref:alkaline phosphatase family protein n=1 Tax=Sinimarinibacterium sp. CAU 1509 TaxID=2562283 RepID=UPI0010AB8A23|nr:alkaline phosphatase family protein [Sinimarinibacterium sp. CAU 1509]TJY63184.1 phosphoesterase [Sinimarinibacterium sp. CAU 1509]
MSLKIQATRTLLTALLGTLLLAACGGSDPASNGGNTSQAAKIGHVFVIVLENKDFVDSFGPDSLAPYLAQTLPAQGAMLENYYGVAHNSLGNYIAMISGQGPNIATQADCILFQDFVGAAPGTLHPTQAIGQGCVYPASVPSLPDQFRERGNLSWKGYMEDMGNDPAREAATCAHPSVNSVDGTQAAAETDHYATRHNPFMYFHSVIDDQAYCDERVVNLEVLRDDLKQIATTPNFSFITPSLCHDGHDSPCVNGEAGGLVSSNEFLETWVPQILASPAFKKDGLLVVTFDEAENFTTDASACCSGGPTLNTPLPGITGLGGGRVGAVLLSPFIEPGTVSQVEYNHYSFLHSVQDFFGLSYLGFADDDAATTFGADVFTRQMPELPPRP